MLPPDVFKLVLLATTALANPQGQSPCNHHMRLPNVSPAASPQAQNATAIASTTRPPAAPLRPHPESSVDGWGQEPTNAPPSNCDAPELCPTSQMLVHVETSVTGFEHVSDVMLQPVGPIQPTQTTPVNRVELVTTSTPSLVSIHTETPTPESSPTPGDTPTPENSPPPGDGLTPSDPHTTSTPNSLMNDIVSHIGISVSSIETLSNPTDNTDNTDNRLPTTSDTDLGHEYDPSQPSAIAQFQQATEADPAPSVSLLGSAPIMTPGSQLTLGSITLTLTPGLSSMLGDGTTATYVAITTDDAGQTLITVSSSGTAVTATITDAPATLTRSRTGFEASITKTASPASSDGPSANRVAAATSSRGLGVHQRAELGQWLYVGVGLVGLGLVAG